MIHKLQNDLQDKNDRKDSLGHGDFSGYLTDEELERLILQVETEEMLPAPRNLKQDILIKLHRRRKALKERQLLFYRVKAAVMMAAAIVVLILMPDVGEGESLFSIPTALERNRETEEQNVLWEQETIEQRALNREEEKADDWRKYQDEMTRDAQRKEFTENLNKKLTQFGMSLWNKKSDLE